MALTEELAKRLEDLEAKVQRLVDGMVRTVARVDSLERQMANIPTTPPYQNPEGR